MTSSGNCARHPPKNQENTVKPQWKTGLRNAAFITALVVPGGFVALLAVALVKRVQLR